MTTENNTETPEDFISSKILNSLVYRKKVKNLTQAVKNLRDLSVIPRRSGAEYPDKKTIHYWCI